MKSRFFAILLILCFCGVRAGGKVRTGETPSQFLMISIPTYDDDAVLQIAEKFETYRGGDKAVGVGMIISYLSQPPEIIEQRLRRFLEMAERNDLPLLVELDGINYWQARPDLWNWWDPEKPGYDPENRNNVEWSSWSPDDAVKIGWRNWGSQHRVLPMPNLSSPAYLEACHTQLKRLVPIILDWWHALPDNKKHLLVAVQIGVELSIGANNWYYPDGNTLYDRPEEEDPAYGLRHDTLPGRGVQPIGYAAVKTAGIASGGELREEQVTEAVDRYATGLCKLASELGVPRDRLFLHAGGWKPGESVYTVAQNPYACPGWSFYNAAAHDPREDKSAMEVVAESDAPYWGAVEWMMFDADGKSDWKKAYRKAFSMPRLRYVQIRHWGVICKNPDAIEAIRETVGK